MRHPSIPATLTTEAAAQWITENALSTFTDEEHLPLTEEKIAELEHKSSKASRAIDDLKEVKDIFSKMLKNGTPIETSTEGDPVNVPFTLVIPATKGTKALEANRKFADDQLKAGEEVIVTSLYFIPDPENGMAVAVDIEGKEWEKYTRPMTNEEAEAKGKLFRKDDAETVTMYPDAVKKGRKKDKKAEAAEEVSAEGSEDQFI